MVAGMPRVSGHKVNKVSLWKMRIGCSPLVDLIANMVGINSTMCESLCDERNGNTESYKLHAEAEAPRYDNPRAPSDNVRHSYAFIRFERQGDGRGFQMSCDLVFLKTVLWRRRYHIQFESWLKAWNHPLLRIKNTPASSSSQ